METLEGLMTKNEVEAIMTLSNYDYIGEIKPYIIYANEYDRIAVERIPTRQGIFYDFRFNYKSPIYHIHKKADTSKRELNPRYDVWI